MSETNREYAANYRKPPLDTRFKKGQSGNPRGRPKKDLPGLLVAPLNEPVFVTTSGRRRKITKREVIVTQMVNESAGANLRATKMLIDMMKDIEKKTSAEPPPEPHRFAPADEEVPRAGMSAAPLMAAARVATAVTSLMCQGTKSLRSSPLRGGKR
jgi:hypothetical protein